LNEVKLIKGMQNFRENIEKALFFFSCTVILKRERDQSIEIERGTKLQRMGMNLNLKSENDFHLIIFRGDILGKQRTPPFQ